MQRRTFLAGVSALTGGLSGCSLVDSTRPAHTVSVYLGDRDATRNVTVTVLDEGGETVFERSFALSDSNEAHEDATFPKSSEPATVRMTVDGEQFEEPWPPFHGRTACSDANYEGIEVWVEGLQGQPPSLRLEGNCQHVTMESG